MDEQLEAVKNLKELTELLIRDLYLTMSTTLHISSLLQDFLQNCCSDKELSDKISLLLLNLQSLEKSLLHRAKIYGILLEKEINPKWQEVKNKRQSLDLSVEELMALDDLQALVDLLKKKGILPPDFLEEDDK